MNPTWESLQRLVAEIDGWLDLRCPDRALERIEPLLANPATHSLALTLRIRAFVAQKRHKDAVADIQSLRTVAAAAAKSDPAVEWCRNNLPADGDDSRKGTEALSDWLDLTEAWCRKRMHDLPTAIRCMEQLVQRNTRSGIGHFNLGCYLALAGDGERALDEVTVACGIDQSFRDMLHDEPDLDSLRGDSRFQQLQKGRKVVDPAEAAAEADAFEDDMAEGFEEDLEFEDQEEGDGEFDEDFDDDDDDDDDDAPPTRGRADGSRR